MPLLVVWLMLLPFARASGDLSARIESLFDAWLEAKDSKQEEQVAFDIEAIFRQHGLPGISEVGDDAAYKFIFLACSPENVPSYKQVLAQAERSVANHDVPSDGALYCQTHIRLELAKMAAEREPPGNPTLRDQIERLYRTDQAVRQKEGFDLKKMEATDQELKAPLDAIVTKYGAPTYEMVGPRAASDFVTLIQHQSPGFRQRVLPKLKSNVDSGQADPGAYATMLDRSLTDLGKPQIYGQNLTCNPEDHKLREGNIERKAEVNQRRAAIGLMRLKIYERLVIQISPAICQ
jgi:hypothetical protein